MTIREQREDDAVGVFERSYDVHPPKDGSDWNSVLDDHVYSHYLSRNTSTVREYFATVTLDDEVSVPVDATTQKPGTNVVSIAHRDESRSGVPKHRREVIVLRDDAGADDRRS